MMPVIIIITLQIKVTSDSKLSKRSTMPTSSSMKQHQTGSPSSKCLARTCVVIRNNIPIATIHQNSIMTQTNRFRSVTHIDEHHNFGICHMLNPNPELTMPEKMLRLQEQFQSTANVEDPARVVNHILIGVTDALIPLKGRVEIYKIKRSNRSPQPFSMYSVGLPKRNWIRARTGQKKRREDSREESEGRGAGEVVRRRAARSMKTRRPWRAPRPQRTTGVGLALTPAGTARPPSTLRRSKFHPTADIFTPSFSLPSKYYFHKHPYNLYFLDKLFWT